MRTEDRLKAELRNRFALARSGLWRTLPARYRDAVLTLRRGGLCKGESILSVRLAA
jgi:hypothetical protein